ncbi:MAG: 3-oxoadipate enol-lactonase [Rhodospirillaceae bacterium]|nr:3-oxoadipate enol-lactonase [Rhodospirillaceae bacterium]
MTSQLVERMAVELDGQGDAIIFVHGLGGTSNVYTPQVLGLSDRYRAIRPDLPGSGRTPPQETTTIQGFVDGLLRLARGLELDRAHLVGHSMGTIICQHLAVQAPRLVRSLVLFGPLLAPPDTARQGLKDRASKVRSEGMAGIADAILQAATSADTRRNQPVAAALVREMLMRQNPEGYARSCEALAAAEPADVRQIGCPTLLVTGDEDSVAPPSGARLLAERIDGARLSVLNRCGHWTTVERAAECTAALKEFYAQAAQHVPRA